MRVALPFNMSKLTIHSVLAGAYKGRDLNARSLLTHASSDGGETALCKKAKNLTDLGERIPQDVAPTCPSCAVRWVRWGQQIVHAESEAARYLGNYNAEIAAGRLKAAHSMLDKSQYWLDRANDLRGW